MRYQNRFQIHSSFARFVFLAICFIGFWLPNPVVAEEAVTVYRWQNPDGSVEFSDESRLGSETIVVEEPMILPFQGVKKARPNPVAAEFTYTSLLIKTPGAGATFRNEAAQSIDVTVEVEPSLRSGDQLVLLLDGTVHAEPGSWFKFTLPRLERGAHSLQLEIHSADGNRIKQSDTITIHVQRNIARPKGGG